jgi:DNA-binding transcriptional MerR regulator
MTLDEFLAETGLPDRTLRHYHQHGVIPHPVPGAGDHGYGELHVLRALAVPRLRESGVRQLRDIAVWLDERSIEELRQFIESGSASPASVEPERAPGPTKDAPIAAVVTIDVPTTHEGAGLGENHIHIPLRDGIVLDIRMPIDDEGLSLVRGIASLCGLNVSLR